MDGYRLFAITQHDGAIPIGEFPSKAARDARLRVERDYHATLGDGEVLAIVTELPQPESRAPPDVTIASQPNSGGPAHASPEPSNSTRSEH